MNNQYEENQRSYSNNRTTRFDSTFERREEHSSKERTGGYYPSPYAAAAHNNYDNTSVSPNARDYRQDGIEETIQGNIDGQMSTL